MGKLDGIEYNLVCKSEDGDVLHVGTVVGKITPKEIWEQKDVWFKQAQDSREEWENMSDENKEALTRMVTGAIERMHDRIDEWLPEGLTVEGGNYVDIHLRFLFTDIDKEIDRNEAATSFQIKAATSETATAIAEMEAKLGSEV
jgi:hypothetical protein